MLDYVLKNLSYEIRSLCNEETFFSERNVFAGIYSGRFGTIRMVVARAVEATQAGSDSTDSEKNFQSVRVPHNS